jgi:hypothetical protein
MVEPKKAVENALRYFTVVTGISNGISLEELERSSDKKYWLVTIGYMDTAGEVNSLNALLGKLEKKYKIVKVNAESGEAESMKIRELTV